MAVGGCWPMRGAAARAGARPRVVVITEPNVQARHGAALQAALDAAGIESMARAPSGGGKAAALQSLCDGLLGPAPTATTIIALGGAR